MSTVTPEISGRHFEITPDVRQLIDSKLARVEDRLFDDVISVRVVMSVEKYRNICEIFIVGKNYDVKVEQESDKSMADAINAALDHAKRQAQKRGKKLHDHHKNDGAAPEKLLDEDRT